MPSPIGHLIAGAAIGLATDRFTSRHPPREATAKDAAPERARDRSIARADSDRRQTPGTLVTRLVISCAVLAALADIDLLYPPIHRSMTHSVGAAVLITIIAAPVTGWVTRRHVWRTAVVCGAAYASHVLMDWMGADPRPPHGIRALWPFSDRWFIAGWDLFPGTERRDVFSMAAFRINARAALQEIAMTGPLLAAIWWWRRANGR
jgi:membrane-bound metal-dependent hydrolase YbcI (DUF457 family)